ncbi:MAG TPA: hypothetical protein VFH89_03290 [Sphingomicrobium sp.]|nr:hypothetical protein [Sphingomicrobium sp.]
MRTLRQVWILAAASACSPASAVLPDSGNPAHCIAGFHYAAYAFKTGGQPERATPMMVRAIFEMEKLKASGTSEIAAREESAKLTRAYANDHEAMMALVRACGEAQDGDPKYRAELPRLIALAPQ